MGFRVDGRLVLATESKAFVDEELVQEKDVVFQNAVIDGINMRETLATQDDIREKVKKVRAIAQKIVERKEKGEGAISCSSSSDSSSDSSADKPKKATDELEIPERSASSIEREEAKLEEKRQKKVRRAEK